MKRPIILLFTAFLVITVFGVFMFVNNEGELKSFSITPEVQNEFINKQDEEVQDVISQDIDFDGKVENIVTTAYVPDPTSPRAYLYIFPDKTQTKFIPIDYLEILGTFRNILLDDLNNDHIQEIIIFSFSGKLLNTSIYSFEGQKLLPLPFRANGEEVKLWSEKKPEFVDIDKDGLEEIVVTHFFQGEVLTETVILKEFFRWKGEYYEKYDEKKTVESGGFQG